jgi:outer membrane autotransporter protein
VWALVPVSGNEKLLENPGYTFEAQKIKGWTDMNLGAEYRFNKALSFWLNVNNLTNSKYYRWNNYRSYGINLLGGVSYSF